MFEQEKVEQTNSPAISSEQVERVEISPEKSPLAPPFKGGEASAKDDNQQQKIQEIKQGIQQIGGDDQQGAGSSGNIPDIKTIEDLLSIKETEIRLEALLKMAKRGEKEEEKALDLAKEIWEDTENAVLLDELRDKLAE